jgi:hypothetical protein
MATSSVAVNKAPAAGKKKEPVAELSEEDAAKKAEIDMLVERCQDADQGIQTQALTQLRTELASSTSSMYVLHLIPPLDFTLNCVLGPRFLKPSSSYGHTTKF